MSTLDKYRKVVQDHQKTEEYEIRLTGRGKLGMYIVYAAKLFMEKKLTKCVLKGSGPAISKVCQASEILRQRIKGLHEQCNIYSTNITDIYEPLEEGLDKVEISKGLTVYEVILSINESEVDKTSVGYQPPLPEDQGTTGGLYRERGGRRGYRRGRGQRGFRRGGRYRNYRGYDDYNDNYYNRPQRGRRPPRYEDDYEQEQQPRQGRRNYDDDYSRRPPRYEDEDEYYEQPRRRGGRRGGGDRGGERRGGERRGGERRGGYERDQYERGGYERGRGERRERGRGDYNRDEPPRPRQARGPPKE